MKRTLQFLIGLLLLLSSTHAFAATINVLWYTGGVAQVTAAQYQANILTLAASAPTAPGNNAWNVGFWSSGPMPVGPWNVLVVASPQGPWATAPNYTALNTAISGGLSFDPSKNRIAVSGQDADWHYQNFPGPAAFDGPKGFLLDTINWAGSGTGLGLVALGMSANGGPVNFGFTGYSASAITSNNVVVPPTVFTFPLNAGLSSAGLSNWSDSIHIEYLFTISNDQWVGISSDAPSNLVTIVSAPFATVDAYQISYAVPSLGDSFVNLTNAGSLGGFDPGGDICANVYVFAEDQQLIACCSCPLTPNHLKTLSVQKDLISNTLTPGVPIAITIALLAKSGACNAASASPATLVPGLRAWGTKLHAAPGGGVAVTENTFSPADLSVTELAKLTSYCGFIQAIGGHFGICQSCQEGAAGAAKQ